MASLAQMSVVNLPHFLQGIVESQKLQLRYMRTELKRGAQRIRKHFIREQLKGPPGIKAGTLAKGKNVFTFVKGDDPKSLYAKIGISRILHVHEKGMTIRPAHGGLLYLREQKGKPNERVVAAVPQVVIPARLRFREQVRRESPAELRKVGEAGVRATEVAMTKALKKTVASL